MYMNFCLRILTKSPAMPQQLYKPASHGFSAIAELLVFIERITAYEYILSYIHYIHKTLLKRRVYTYGRPYA